jgi:two-component system chemotaxis sensor kinase CheA
MSAEDLSREESRTSEKVKVDTGRLDAVVDLVGELVVLKSQILETKTIREASDPELTAVLSLIDRTVRELQERTLAIRMGTMRGIFSRTRKVILDLAEQLGKLVEVELRGEDVELDRSVIEAITEPFVHIARNAVDHGVEAHMLREKRGKPPIAKIVISAESRPGGVLISMSDDGKGIRTADVLEKAKAKGLLSRHESTYSKAEIHEFIMQPGFSTLEEVSEISGRGVGLDIVRSCMERVGGSVQIISEEGQGTRFELEVPTSTAMSEGLLVVAGEEPSTLILPLQAVREIRRVAAGDSTTLASGERVIESRGEFLPLFDLDLLSRPSTAAPVEDRTLIIIEHRRQRYGVLCRRVIGQSQVVVKGLGDYLHLKNAVAGGAILGDGRIALLLDPDVLPTVLDLERVAA